MLLLVVENKMHCGIKQYIILLSKYKFNCICTYNRYSLLKWIKQILIYSHKSSLNFPSSYSPNTIMIPLSHLPLSLKKKTIKRTNKIKVRYQKAPHLEKKNRNKTDTQRNKTWSPFFVGMLHLGMESYLEYGRRTVWHSASFSLSVSYYICRDPWILREVFDNAFNKRGQRLCFLIHSNTGVNVSKSLTLHITPYLFLS